MEMLNFTGSTIFKFHRSEKKWREKGCGDVSFLLKGDELMVGLGKQSFFVKGGIRPKGPNAVVMRVWGIETSSNEPDMILAVRFGKERDAKKLSAMLSDKMLDKSMVRMSRTARKLGKPPLPSWFASLSRNHRSNIQSLIKNANPKYLNDGTIHMQLARMYDLSPGQVEEVVNFFNPRRAGTKQRDMHRRAVSWSMNSGSSFPSFSNHNPSGWSGSKRYHAQIGLPHPPVKSPQKPRVVNGRHMRLPNSTGTFKRDQSSRGNLSEFSAQRLRNPPILRPHEIGPNPNTQLLRKNNSSKVLNKSNIPTDFKGKPGFEENLRATPEEANGNFSQEKLAQLGPIFENSNPTQGNRGSSTDRGNSPEDIVEKDSNLPLSPLTKQNLLLYNRMKPPLKGDYRTIVRTWLQKSIP